MQPNGARPRRSPKVRLATSLILAIAVFGGLYYQRSKQNVQPGPTATDARPFTDAAPDPDRFAWVPRYPGAELSDLRSVQSKAQFSYGFTFKTTDDTAKVLDFFQSRMKAAGFLASIDLKPGLGGELHAVESTSKGTSRTLDVTVGKAADGNEVGVSAVVPR